MHSSPIALAAIVAVSMLQTAPADAADQRKPDVTLKVTVSPLLTRGTGKQEGGNEARAYQEVADTLNQARIGPNNDRRLYFQQHPTPERILGWTGMIEKVGRTRSGDLVATVRVQAKLDGAHDNFFLNERYTISDRQVKYVGCSLHRAADQPYFSSGK